jgi:4-amino-4-deoxy-L-arabinose transferase-like glycosyltransferase
VNTNGRRPDWLVWSLWLALLAGVAILSRPALPLDETRYLAVAWEMWQRGDLLVPFKNGEPYSHKPPLLFWLIHAGWWLTGVNDWWPRLISPGLALAATWMTWRLARRLWPETPATAYFSPLVLLSSLLWLLYSQALFFDVLIAVCALIGLTALVEAALTDRRRWWTVFGLGIGIGVLAKGPAILVHLLPAALLAPWWLRHASLAERPSWRRWYTGVGLGLLLGVVIALAWAIPAGLSGGEDYRNAIFWGQTANRMVESFAHRRPFWWYLAALPLFLFPWLFWPHLLGRLAKILRAEREDAGVRFALAWFGAALLIFSSVSGKQPHYLLPELPAAALLIGHALARSPALRRPWLPGIALLAAGAAASYLAMAPVDPKGALRLAGHLPAWAGLGFALAGLLALSRAGGIERLAWASLLSALWLLLALVRPISQAYDVAPMARELARHQALGHPVANEGKYHAQYQFAGRLQRPLAVLNGKALARWLERHPDGVAVVYLGTNEDPAPYRPLFSHAFRGSLSLLIDRGGAAALGAQAARPADDSED